MLELQYISKLGINYLSKLDYVDISNLSRVNKFFDNTCNDNEFLRNLLYVKNINMELPLDFDINLAMKDIDYQMEKIYSLNYPFDMIFPKWIDKKLFKEHMKRVIYVEIYFGLNGIIYDHLTKNIDVSNINEIYISRSRISLTFAPKGTYLYCFDDDENQEDFAHVENTIKISECFKNYIIYATNKLYDKEGYKITNTIPNNNIELLLQDLLFLQDYTFEDGLCL